jgi:hypothetical protein
VRVTVVLIAFLVVGGIFATTRPQTGAFAASAWSDLAAPEPTPDPVAPSDTPTTTTPTAVSAAAAADTGPGCATPDERAPTGRLVAGQYADRSPVTVEVEDGLALDADCVAGLITEALRGSVEEVTVAIVSPEMVARLCAPLDTTGLATCWNGSRALIDAERWAAATADERDELVRGQVEAALGPGIG